MKGKMFTPAFIALLLIVTAAITAINVWLRGLELRGVSGSAERMITARGTVCDIHDARGDTLTLREISPEGALMRAVGFSKNGADGKTRRTVHILAEEDELVYLSINELPYASPQTQNSFIAVCDMRTGHTRTLCEMRGGLLEIAGGISQGGLFYAETGGALTVYRVDIQSGETRLWDTAPLPFALTWFAVADGGTLYAVSPDSRVYRLRGAEWEDIYLPGSMSAVQLSTAGGALYLFAADSENGDALLKLAPGADSFEAVREGIRDIYRVNALSEDTWVALKKDGGYRVSVSGETRDFPEVRVPPRFLLTGKTLVPAALEAAAAVIILCAARHIYKRRRVSLVLKLALAVVPVFAVGTAVIIAVSAGRIRALMYESARAAILSDSREKVSGINAARFARINWDEPFSSEYFLSLRNQLRGWSGLHQRTVYDASGHGSQGEQVTTIYMNYWLYRVEGKRVYVAVCDNSIVNLDMDYHGTLAQGEERDYLLEKRTVPVFMRQYDRADEGAWLSLMYPVLDGETLVGLLEVSTPEWDMAADIESVVSQMTRLCLYVLSALIAALAAVLAVTMRALGRLRRGAVAVADGDYGARVNVRNLDETGEIASAFNSMAASVENAIVEIRSVSDAYSRFVPREMLSVLDKASIRDVRAADCIQTRAMFLLLMTESFDTHEDHLVALNRFYARILPALAKFGGVAERFNSRELRALLDCAPSKAADAALSMLAAVNRLNEEAAGTPYGEIECSILLAYADSFLGVAGDGGRLNMTLFSRFSHKADEIRPVGLRYGCRLMVEQGAFDAMENANVYRFRRLGIIGDGGETRNLYDFYDGDTAAQIQKKDASLDMFRQGVDCYYSADYTRARRAFLEILKKGQDDPSSREYLKQSHARQNTDTPPETLFTV
ncbi:MAG: HAMP domain-containing protein [Oscillospiraceae bacterium]|jgi:HAMP domain-containing protein|nr:HAMP domain-containing protein [Oscillospiraceae bacterium]